MVCVDVVAVEDWQVMLMIRVTVYGWLFERKIYLGLLFCIDWGEGGERDFPELFIFRKLS